MTSLGRRQILENERGSLQESIRQLTAAERHALDACEGIRNRRVLDAARLAGVNRELGDNGRDYHHPAPSRRRFPFTPEFAGSTAVTREVPLEDYLRGIDVDAELREIDAEPLQ